MTASPNLASGRLTSWLRVGRPVLRAQLALLYSGLFVGLLAIGLLAANLLVARGAAQAPNGPGPLPGIGGPADAARDFAVASAVGGLVVALLALAGAWWLGGRFLRPLRAMTAAAQEISATNLHRRLALTGPKDELTELGRTLDDLFGRLDASFESQRRFVANASHELRTPLAGQRAVLQVALADPDATAGELRAACEEALQLGAQQEQLIAALLTLASSEGGVDRWEELDLGAVAERVLAERQREAEGRGLHVTAALSPAPAAGDPMLVERLIANLVDNALRHNLPDGAV
ncbi:MAG TPA: histidine kinase dimerization/phospho-acceptor domain-containing protein, partial [Acidimicrobiales bacterium]|nr:histidine kinase dimerization/phospho-acceptor domain-containing protein [Acidimicrobiales bacterium]